MARESRTTRCWSTRTTTTSSLSDKPPALWGRIRCSFTTSANRRSRALLATLLSNSLSIRCRGPTKASSSTIQTYLSMTVATCTWAGSSTSQALQSVPEMRSCLTISPTSSAFRTKAVSSAPGRGIISNSRSPTQTSAR